MGALITAAYLQSRKHDPDHFFTYLSSPPVGIGGGVGEVVKLLPGELFKKLSSMNKGVLLPGMVDPNQLSTDLSVGQAYMDDPLTMKSLHTKLLLGLIATSKQVFSRPLRIQTPTVCSVGSEDRVVCVSELVKYFTLIDKSVKLQIFKGARHEVHNEVEAIREKYFAFLEHEMLQSIKKE
jgi:alpha-beta hydrolase superfamily lysophospholipase